MVSCAYAGCGVTSARKIYENGYCSNHQDAARSNKTCQRLDALETQNKELVEHLKKANYTIVELYKHLNMVIGAVNRSNYQNDELEQYGRKEAFRVIDTPELPVQFDANGKIVDKEDCKSVAIEAAKLVGVELEKGHIQRAHRIGKRRLPTKQNPNPKARQLIVKLKDSDQRMSVILNKKKLQDEAKKRGVDKFYDAYIAEDLTPMRSKLLWYAKNRCDGKFKTCHTKDGRIKAKLASNSDSTGWITISNPDDFHAHGIDIDHKEMNKGMRKFQILKILLFLIYY